MEKKKVQIIAKYLGSPAQTKEKVLNNWNKLLNTLNATHGEVITALEDLLEQPGEMLGLTGEELCQMARVLGIKRINRLVFRKVSPNDQEKYPELGEDAAPAPGTSFTSTANVAKYPSPLGTFRSDFYRMKKKKK